MAAIKLTCKKMDHYYSLTDSSNVYHIAIFYTLAWNWSISVIKSGRVSGLRKLTLWCEGSMLRCMRRQSINQIQHPQTNQTWTNWTQMMDLHHLVIFLLPPVPVQVRSRNTSASPLRMWKIPWSGGSPTNIHIRTFIAWLWTIWAFLVSQAIYFIEVDSDLCIATSTAVEWVFSQGHHLLLFTRNSLSPSLIRAFLCFGSWARCGLVVFDDVVAAVSAKQR